MKLHSLFFMLLTLLCGSLCLGATPSRAARKAAPRAKVQMTVVINSLADDADAHAWDDPSTPDIDESRDGIVNDAAGRKTLRAAIEEAWSMADGASVPIDITLSMNGVLTLDETQGQGLTLPDGSALHGNNLTTIDGSGTFSGILALGESSTITGINFRNGYILVGI